LLTKGKTAGAQTAKKSRTRQENAVALFMKAIRVR
jgi:hypothetical protein